jgi:hypothetical protein
MTQVPRVMKQPHPPQTEAEREEARAAFVVSEITNAAMETPVLPGRLAVWVIGLRPTFCDGDIWTLPKLTWTFTDMAEAEAAADNAVNRPRLPGRWWAIIVDGRTP